MERFHQKHPKQNTFCSHRECFMFERKVRSFLFFMTSKGIFLKALLLACIPTFNFTPKNSLVAGLWAALQLVHFLIIATFPSITLCLHHLLVVRCHSGHGEREKAP